MKRGNITCVRGKQGSSAGDDLGTLPNPTARGESAAPDDRVEFRDRQTNAKGVYAADAFPLLAKVLVCSWRGAATLSE